jgi:tRNA 5-methylaminomethyl-2-thiouridine biosynthesis bifunctional protein
VPEPIIPARLAFQEGIPYSEEFGDVYHSAAGAIGQAQHVFLNGNRVRERWSGRERFCILETGFGAGLNFLVTWQAWRRDPQRCAKLHFVSIEKHPFTLADAQAVHARHPELAREAAELHARWPLLVPGAQRIELDNGKVVLTPFFGDVKVARELRLRADAFYLDGFAPAKNAEMWTPALMRALSRLAAPEATAATWSVAANVRQALEEAGFVVEKRPGFADKREMLVARCTKGLPGPSLPGKKASVIGAGLAGAAVCERLCARGWDVTLYERHAAAAQEASGNHAGTFHPLVTPDDSLIARLTRAGFLYSLSAWERLEGVRWDRSGVLQLARNEKEDASQRKALAALSLPPEYAQYATREEASVHAGVPVVSGGLWFPQGGWIQPKTLVEAQLAACGARLQRRFSSEVKEVPKEGIVVLCNSAEATKLQPVPHLRLRRVRGQVSYLPEDAVEAPHAVVLRGGMVLPPVNGLCVVGASFDIDDEDPEPRADSHAGNLERLRGVLPNAILTDTAVEGRVAFRAVAPDRLPLVGKLGQDVYGAFAYGSRGLVWAGLAAELIACELEGEPLPLEGKLVEALAPGRFAARALRRGKS